MTATTGRDEVWPGLGWTLALFACSTLGLLLIAIGDALSRATVSSSPWPFWVGLLIIFAPTTFRLLSPEAHRNERLCLVVLLGLSLYLVKVFLEPFGFTFADELAHEPNANAILYSHHLFTETSILPVTSSYPGLEAVTAALAAMTGLTAFGAGMIVIAISRVVLMLALFLLFERISGSPRVAGVGAAIYTANANFVFFDSQFSYESLALPLLVAVLAGLAERQRAPHRKSWTSAILLLIAAIVATHHITSYLLFLFLLALCVAYALVARDRVREAPAGLALVTLLAAFAWLGGVATATVVYLKPVLLGAFRSTVHTVQGTSRPRALFASAAYQPPLLERITGVVSVLILVALVPIGLRTLLKRHRTDPYAIVLAVAGAAYFGTLALRYVPAAWETANRASEFLFIGLAFVVAMTVLGEPPSQRRRAIALPVLGAALAIVFAGGVIAGWDASLRLGRPYLVKAKGAALSSEGRAMAGFAATHLPGERFAASESDARLLATYARAWAYTGRSPDVYDILRDPTLATWELRLLRQLRVRYLAVDLRERSWDNLAGYFFGVLPPFGQPDKLLPRASLAKFSRAGFSKIYDSGDIAIFVRPA